MAFAAQFLETPVYFTKELETVEVMEGEDTQLICETSKPNVPVKWYKNGDELISGLHFKINGQGNQCILSVIEAKVKDTQTYTCKIVSSDNVTAGKLIVKGINKSVERTNIVCFCVNRTTCALLRCMDLSS